MPRGACGYSYSDWIALPIEERERIKKENARQAINKCHRQQYAANIEKKREYFNEVYHRNKEERIQKVREYQKRKKSEQEEYVATLESELEKYKTEILILKDKLMSVGITV